VIGMLYFSVFLAGHSFVDPFRAKAMNPTSAEDKKIAR
jgi:hypothetical protein